jgi:hypothetical protein
MKQSNIYTSLRAGQGKETTVSKLYFLRMFNAKYSKAKKVIETQGELGLPVEKCHHFGYNISTWLTPVAMDLSN